jgi:hypothetical protein
MISRNTCCNLIWWVQKTFLKIVVISHKPMQLCCNSAKMEQKLYIPPSVQLLRLIIKYTGHLDFLPVLIIYRQHVMEIMVVKSLKLGQITKIYSYPEILTTRHNNGKSPQFLEMSSIFVSHRLGLFINILNKLQNFHRIF